MLEEIKGKVGQFTVFKTVKEAMKGLKSTRLFALDIETSGFEKKVGGVSTCDKYGVCGIALCNLMGDAAYLLVSDSRDNGGIPIQEAIEYLNSFWFRNGSVAVIHNSKYDLGFLVRRGLETGNVKIYDSWLMSSIRSQGAFTSNKLKDIVKVKFGVEPKTLDEKEKFFTENTTQDFGDLPVELIAPYAADDTRYSLLLLLGQAELTQQDWQNHDLYVRNNQHLIRAEHRGCIVHHEKLKERLAKIDELLEIGKKEIKAQLGAVDVDVDDDQKMLAYLHVKGLHSAPRDYYGKVEFVFDAEYLQSVSDHPLADLYYTYILRRNFKQAFSVLNGDMHDKYFQNTQKKQVGFHPQHQPSIFSKGGLVQLRAPDITNKVRLTNQISELFKPREGCEFVSIRAVDLPSLILGFYTQDSEIGTTIRDGQSVNALMAKRTGLKPEACRCLLRQMIEGSGNAVLERRFKLAGVTVGNKAHLQARDKFEAAIPGFTGFRKSVEKLLASGEALQDRCGRALKMPQDKTWRAPSMLIQSSNGSILSTYLDLFCRLASETGAYLLLVHESNFLFEVNSDTTEFLNACRDLIARPVLDPKPVWKLKQGRIWSGEFDSHEAEEKV